ncbi:RDD family protein [Propionicicella superfundia]|uniref:RDD family protein n=1 Tax=Propionicicella superfundia TaxID=348582 RepID=UPI00040DA5D3|nr:RDD family protein [Propionicicella superfundia]
MSQIVTGDAVLLDLRPARIPTRILADLVDISAILLLTWGWNTLTTSFGGSAAAQQAVALAGYIIISFGYLIGFETLTRGRTPGAYVVGLQAVRDDGGTIRFRHALMRGLAFWLVDYSLYTGFLLGTIVSILQPDGKRIGDVLAGTLVIRVRAPRAAGALPEIPPHLVEWAATLEMSRVTDEQFAAARTALQRDRLMRKSFRTALLGRLAYEVSRRTAPLPPPGVPPEDFLAAVCGENRRRAGLRVQASRAVPSAGELPVGWR